MAIKNFIKKILNSRLAKITGVSLINYDLLKYVKHYSWIFNFAKIPTLKITYFEPRVVIDDDVKICQRLIAAYRKVSPDNLRAKDNISQLWSDGLRKHCNELISVMDSGSAEDLAKILSRMFREDFVYGLASGSLIENSRSGLGAKIWSMKYQDNLIALAEYLGVIRTESTQQGEVAHFLKEGVDSIVAKIEENVGISISFPDIGAPYGIKAANSLITMEHPEHLYVALRIGQAIKDYLKGKESQSLNLVEIGAGFGGLAYWVMKLGKIKVGNYIILDLPIINVLQGYFLAQAFGASAVRLYGEASVNNAPHITILPNFTIEKNIVSDIDVLINENSMPEMSEAIVQKYIIFAKEYLSGLFFSYNHEAYSAVYGKLQVSVPEAVDKVGGFTRFSRNASWVRNGYVEEVYKKEQR